MDQEKCEVLFVNTDIIFSMNVLQSAKCLKLLTDYSFVVILQLLPWVIQQM